MIYVFDTNSFSILKEYYRAHFRRFWECFEEVVSRGEVVSVREVYRELLGQVDRPHLQEWIESHRRIFLPPSQEESLFIKEIFAIPHYRYLIKPKNLLVSTPWADPFVIAAAKIKEGCVVTEEHGKRNAAKIPNVCEHFQIPCKSLETFIEEQKWEF